MHWFKGTMLLRTRFVCNKNSMFIEGGVIVLASFANIDNYILAKLLSDKQQVTIDH